MNIAPEPRIGDRERAAAASALGEHFAEGRLTREEYDERSSQVWSAKTAADLRPLFADLPPVGDTQPRMARPPAPGPGTSWAGRGERAFRFPWVPAILLVIGLSFLLPGPWWLLLLGAVLFSRSMRRGGCSSHPRARAGR